MWHALPSSNNISSRKNLTLFKKWEINNVMLVMYDNYYTIW